jgi:hypothetical protein
MFSDKLIVWEENSKVEYRTVVIDFVWYTRFHPYYDKISPWSADFFLATEYCKRYSE